MVLDPTHIGLSGYHQDFEQGLRLVSRMVVLSCAPYKLVHVWQPAKVPELRYESFQEREKSVHLYCTLTTLRGGGTHKTGPPACKEYSLKQTMEETTESGDNGRKGYSVHLNWVKVWNENWGDKTTTNNNMGLGSVDVSLFDFVLFLLSTKGREREEMFFHYNSQDPTVLGDSWNCTPKKPKCFPSFGKGGERG